jgi:hypothetical protein
MSYADLLKDRRWQKKRLEVLDAAGWVCERCESADNSQQLHVHHRRYVRGRKPWEYSVHELQALCESCHKLAGDEIKNLDDAIADLKLSCGPAEIDQVIGFARAVVVLSNGPDRMRINTYEQAMGAYQACEGHDADFVIDRLEGDLFDIQRLRDLISEPPELRKDWPR